MAAITTYKPMTKRTTRAERIRDACPGYDPPPMTHAEQFADLALEAEGLLRGACRMRDLYRAERARTAEALRERDELRSALDRLVRAGDAVATTEGPDNPAVAEFVDAADMADVLLHGRRCAAWEAVAIIRGRQERRHGGGGNG